MALVASVLLDTVSIKLPILLAGYHWERSLGPHSSIWETPTPPKLEYLGDIKTVTRSVAAVMHSSWL